MSERVFGLSGNVALVRGGHTGIGPVFAMRIMMRSIKACWTFLPLRMTDEPSTRSSGAQCVQVFGFRVRLAGTTASSSC